MHNCLSLLNQRRFCLLLPPCLLVTFTSQLLDLQLKALILFLHSTTGLGLARLRRLRRLLADPGFGTLLNFHGDYVLHGLLYIVFVEVRRDLPILELLKKLILLPDLLPLLFYNVLELLCAILSRRDGQRRCL